MHGKIFRTIALMVVHGYVWRASAQETKTKYPQMAPVEQYLMERSAEIALARIAAPDF